MKTYFTVREASGFLKIHIHSVYRLIYERKIPFIRKRGVGLRIDPDALEQWIQEGKVEPKDQGSNGTRAH